MSEDNNIIEQSNVISSVAMTLLSYGFLYNSWMKSADAKIAYDGNAIIAVSDEILPLFGHSRKSLIGHPLEILLPERFREPHKQHIRSYTHHPRHRPMGEGRELFGLHKDGTEFRIFINLTFYFEDEIVLFEATIREIK